MAAVQFDAARHIRYFQRCYKSVLPHHYTPADSTRLALGYFMLAGLDLLSSPSSRSAPKVTEDASKLPSPSFSLIPPADRKRLRDWVLSLQLVSGGFCGSPHHAFPSAVDCGYYSELHYPVGYPVENANLAATYFALVMLGIVADEGEEGAREVYRCVNREATLQWLCRLQREDGSFGELVDSEGDIWGGRDMRYCYMAAVIRWILRANDPRHCWDINVDGMVKHIQRSQNFDGGMAESSMGESHAGYAYCAVAALHFLDLAKSDGDATFDKLTDVERADPNHYLKRGIPDIPALVRWLVERQFEYTDEEEDDDTAGADASNTQPPDLSSLNLSDSDPLLTGFNGRLNKKADSCYTWWVSGTISMLSEAMPGTVKVSVPRMPARNFMIEKMQHFIGGFGKSEGDPPDLQHSYLGLAALATMAGDEGEPGLGKFDAGLCVGREAAQRVAMARKYVKMRFGAKESLA